MCADCHHLAPIAESFDLLTREFIGGGVRRAEFPGGGRRRWNGWRYWRRTMRYFWPDRLENHAFIADRNENNTLPICQITLPIGRFVVKQINK